MPSANFRTVKVRCTRGDGEGCPSWCGYYPHVVQVTVLWICPVCHEARGEPTSSPFFSDGMHFDAETWKNGCGHIDKYNDVLKEAERLKEAL